MNELLSLFGQNRVPVYTLDFTSSLPTGFTHTSNDTIKTYRNSSGQLQVAAANTAIFDYDSNGNALGLQCFESRVNPLHQPQRHAFGHHQYLRHRHRHHIGGRRQQRAGNGKTGQRGNRQRV